MKPSFSKFIYQSYQLIDEENEEEHDNDELIKELDKDLESKIKDPQNDFIVFQTQIDLDRMGREWFYAPGNIVKNFCNKGFPCEILYQHSEEDGYQQIIWGSLDPNQAWLISMNGTIGEYYDDDYDINGSLEFFLNDYEHIKKYINHLVEEDLQSAVNKFFNSMKNAQAIMNKFQDDKTQFVFEQMFDGQREESNKLQALLEQEHLEKNLEKGHSNSISKPKI